MRARSRSGAKYHEPFYGARCDFYTPITYARGWRKKGKRLFSPPARINGFTASEVDESKEGLWGFGEGRLLRGIRLVYYSKVEESAESRLVSLRIFSIMKINYKNIVTFVQPLRDITSIHSSDIGTPVEIGKIVGLFLDNIQLGTE